MLTHLVVELLESMPWGRFRGFGVGGVGFRAARAMVSEKNPRFENILI